MTPVPASSESATRSGRTSKFVCEVRFGVRASAWIHLAGELDIASAPQFERALDRTLSAAVLIVVDLRELTFIDIIGARTVGDGHDRARRRKRRLVIVRGPRQVDRLLELAELSERLLIISLKTVLASTPAQLTAVHTCID